ncbi:MAG TPA: nucleotidyltransferase family protein [Actinomycetales bacterium]|nr:nucleotidyltransferase family protein [Actinomycetales bacterium]
MRTAVIVVAGGRSTRFGSDKLKAPLGPGQTVLSRTLAGIDHLDDDTQLGLVRPVVVVGPADRAIPAATDRVCFVLEDPPGSGPAAAVLAGARAACVADVLVVMPGDAPFAAGAVPRLVAALVDSHSGLPADAAVAVDPTGHRQHLLLAVRAAGAWDLDADLCGRPARQLLEGLTVVEVPVTEREALDIDEPGDLDRIRSLS